MIQTRRMTLLVKTLTYSEAAVAMVTVKVFTLMIKRKVHSNGSYVDSRNLYIECSKVSNL